MAKRTKEPTLEENLKIARENGWQPSRVPSLIPGVKMLTKVERTERKTPYGTTEKRERHSLQLMHEASGRRIAEYDAVDAKELPRLAHYANESLKHRDFSGDPNDRAFLRHAEGAIKEFDRSLYRPAGLTSQMAPKEFRPPPIDKVRAESKSVATAKRQIAGKLAAGLKASRAFGPGFKDRAPAAEAAKRGEVVFRDNRGTHTGVSVSHGDRQLEIEKVGFGLHRVVERKQNPDGTERVIQYGQPVENMTLAKKVAMMAISDPDGARVKEETVKRTGGGVRDREVVATKHYDENRAKFESMAPSKEHWQKFGERAAASVFAGSRAPTQEPVRAPLKVATRTAEGKLTRVDVDPLTSRSLSSTASRLLPGTGPIRSAAINLASGQLQVRTGKHGGTGERMTPGELGAVVDSVKATRAKLARAILDARKEARAGKVAGTSSDFDRYVEAAKEKHFATGARRAELRAVMDPIEKRLTPEQREAARREVAAHAARTIEAAPLPMLTEESYRASFPGGQNVSSGVIREGVRRANAERAAENVAKRMETAAPKPQAKSGALHQRAAAALGWTPEAARSMSLSSLREMVRAADPGLADEITEHIRAGSHISQSRIDSGSIAHLQAPDRPGWVKSMSDAELKQAHEEARAAFKANPNATTAERAGLLDEEARARAKSAPDPRAALRAQAAAEKAASIGTDRASQVARTRAGIAGFLLATMQAKAARDVGKAFGAAGKMMRRDERLSALTPEAQAMARALMKSGHSPVRAVAKAIAQHMVQTGPRGGRYYVTAGGSKRYVRPGSLVSAHAGRGKSAT